MFRSVAGGGVLGESGEGEKTGRDGGLKHVQLVASDLSKSDRVGCGRRKTGGTASFCRWQLTAGLAVFLCMEGACVGSKATTTGGVHLHGGLIREKEILFNSGSAKIPNECVQSTEYASRIISASLPQQHCSLISDAPRLPKRSTFQMSTTSSQRRPWRRSEQTNS